MKPLTIPPKFDLRKYYTIFLETGMIITLLSFIVMMNIHLRPAEQDGITAFSSQEIVEMEEIQQTKQEEKPPSPPRPAVPVEVPNSEIIEEEIINIDAEIDFDESLHIPPPPAEKKAEAEVEENFFVVVEEMPSLIGGIQSLQGKIVYPEKARMAGIEGLVIVQFIVNEKGEVEDPRVIRGIGGGCDEEALRAINTARFKPGRQRGKPVRVQYSLPVIFKLQN